LEWYFQAIQPHDAQGVWKPWQVRSNAQAAALKLFSCAILVHEELNAAKRGDVARLFDNMQRDAAQKRWNLGKVSGKIDMSVTQYRLLLLLERTGLTNARGFDEAKNVKEFYALRNDATHPVTFGSRSDDDIIRIVETLRHSSRDTRYDLTTRDPSW
jgi:hypothetical protein